VTPDRQRRRFFTILAAAVAVMLSVSAVLFRSEVKRIEAGKEQTEADAAYGEGVRGR